MSDVRQRSPMRRSDFPRRAVVTGLGPVTPIGIGRAAFWEGILGERSGVGRVTCFDAAPFHARSAAEIRGFDPRDHFPPHRLKRLDRYAQFAVLSARLALEDAGLAPSPEAPDPRMGIAFGSALGGIANAEHEHVRFLEHGPKRTSRALALQVFGGAAHSNIAIEFGIQGVATTNSNSCASGNVALGEALGWIRTGRADVVVAGAAEAPLAPLTFCAFDNIHTMSRFQGEPAAHACRPFDRRRDGFVMGEGAASLVVEDLGHALARGADILAEVLGFSHNNEAHHMTTPHPTGAPLRRAVLDALDDAEIDRHEIDYVNAHASATQLNDLNEAIALREIFGEERIPALPITGTKAFTGHALGATGAMELVLCTLAMRHGRIPPTLHLDEVDAGCEGFDFVPHHGRDQPLRTVLSNAFGFGGINSCVVLRRWDGE